MAKLDFPVEVLAENYIAHVEGNGPSPHTIAGFRRVLNGFRRLLSEKGEAGTKEDLCPEAVAAYRAHLIGKKYALSSVRFHVQVLKAWSAYLTEEQVYRTDPLARRGLLPKIPKPLPKFLTEDERGRIVDHLGGPDPTNARNLAIFCLFLDTGLRVSELAAIKIGDVDWRRNEIKVWGKGSKERRVGFGKKTARYLRGYVDFHRCRVEEEGVSEDRLFLCHGGHRRDGEETIGEPLIAKRGEARLPPALGKAADQAGAAQPAAHLLDRLPEQRWLGRGPAADAGARDAPDEPVLRPRDQLGCGREAEEQQRGRPTAATGQVRMVSGI
jgi:site-specific recombinase XerD